MSIFSAFVFKDIALSLYSYLFVRNDPFDYILFILSFKFVYESFNQLGLLSLTILYFSDISMIFLFLLSLIFS